ncbi:helix-turn-helix transcriptional regulator [Sulfitobacter albidus]|uniref:Helix-turn-helix transcriptional regulator n=1 Tax=Sulfitobacter albidus TaxID=2829501 RepID=A0A975JBD4_9RHOB|nr:AraC family transcriptional regulator [Sulfitobacter albidus]QUJ75252.1 helix-turn-helix transcriptional regulator [Sulfitobacter albidus]
MSDTFQPSVLNPETIGAFLTEHGAEVRSLDFSGCVGLSGQIVKQGNVRLNAPPLDHHFLEVTLSGFHRGTAHADGMVGPTTVSARPGMVSFRPADRAMGVDVVGQGENLQLLISRDVMDQAKAELLKGDPDRADLWGFNTLDCKDIRHMMMGLAKGHPATQSTQSCAEAALNLARGIVRNFSTGPLIEDADTPRLTRAQLIQSMELIETCISLNTGIDRIAERLGLSLSYFAKAFTAATDLTPGAFLRERQVERAIEWIEVVDITDEDDQGFVVHACGYRDFGAMNAAFIRLRGVDVITFSKQIS